VHSYLGRDDFKRTLGSTMATNDVALRRALEGVAQQFDDWLDRTFQPYQATRVYTARDPFSLTVDDLLSVSAVRMDQDGDRVYEVALTTADWEASPVNAAVERKPYQWLDTQPNGSWRFTGVRRGMQVSGTWGYWQDLANVGAKLSSALDATSTSFQLASSTTLQPQQTILIGSEQVYIGELSTGGVAQVERGVNGTSATSHTTADQIQVYRYPGPIVQAAQIQTLRIHKRKDAPLGVVAGGLDVTEGVVQVIRFDPDVENLLKTYRRYEFLAV
jgi:hypothetical protein